MNRLMPLILLATTLGVSAADPRRELATGHAAYEKGDYGQAASNFAAAAEGAAKEGLDAAVPFYNRGASLLQAGQAAPAAEQLQAAARTPNLDVQQRALFNRGNALFQLAGELEKAEQTQPALQAMEESLAMYEQAMALKPRDLDPKVNFELATREKKRLEEVVKQQQQQQQQNQKDKSEEKEKEEDQQQKQDPSDASDKSDQSDKTEKKEQQSQASEQPQQQPEQKPGSAQEMTPEEASRLLDAMKEQEQSTREQMARDRMRMNMDRLPPPSKDW